MVSAPTVHRLPKRLRSFMFFNIYLLVGAAICRPHLHKTIIKKAPRVGCFFIFLLLFILPLQQVALQQVAIIAAVLRQLNIAFAVDLHLQVVGVLGNI